MPPTPPSKKKVSLLGTVPGQHHEMYPEAIPRGEEEVVEWEIKNGSRTSVDLIKHKMTTSLVDYNCPCGANHADALRMLAYGHTGWTPDNTEQQARAYGDAVVKSKYRSLVEDARVLQKMHHHVHDDIANPTCLSSLQGRFLRALSSQDVPAIISTMLEANATPDGVSLTREFIRKLKTDVPLIFPYLAYIQDAIKTHIHGSGERGTYEDTLNLTYRLEDIEESMGEMFEAIAAMEDEEAPADITELEMAAKDWGHAIPEMSEMDAQWGTMRIERAPLTQKAAVKPTRKWTARDEGVIPRSIHRYSVDGRIFAQPVHKDRGYNILIDASGSMSWRPEHLHEILRKAPATRVALYSGNRTSGILRIVSENGWRAIDSFIESPDDGNNCIDGPALRWLAKQKGMKIWLSDGHVTGISDHSNDNLFKDAAEVVRRGRIMQTLTAEETIAVVKGEQPWRWKPARRR